MILWSLKCPCVMSNISTFLVFLLIAAKYTAALDNGTIYREITKLAHDTQEYKALVLSNGIEVILISDPTSIYSAASLCVTVGSLQNPHEIQGLAHLVEHLLIKGMSEKHPEKHTFFKHLFENGGDYDATTHLDVTLYGFSIRPPAFKEAVEMFASTFSSPYFPPELIEQEVISVNSEFMMNHQNDGQRIWRVAQETAATDSKTKHPFSNFENGNYKSLWEQKMDLQTALKDFFEKHYIPNKMYLAVVGPQNLTELEEIVEDNFLRIPIRENKTENLLDLMENPFWNHDAIVDRIDILPLSKMAELRLVFPVEYTPLSFGSSGLSYVLALINKQGEGSLGKFLKIKGLSEYLVATEYTTGGFSFIQVQIGLTPSGETEMETLVKYFFEYIETLRESVGHENVWKEVYRETELKFLFKEPQRKLDIITAISKHMPFYPLDKVLFADGPELGSTFEKMNINSTLNYIDPINLRIYVTSPFSQDFVNQTEEYYNVKYSRQNVAQKLIEEWEVCEPNPVFHLPKPNAFIPMNFTFKPRDVESEQNATTPRILGKSKTSEVWYIQSRDLYVKSQAEVSGNILSALANKSPLDSVLTSIWVTLATDAISDIATSLSEIGTTAYVLATDRGISVKVKGFSDKIEIILDQLFSKIPKRPPSSGKFEDAKEQITRLLQNAFITELPNVQANNAAKTLFEIDDWSYTEQLEVIKGATLSKFRAFQKQFLSTKKFIWLFSGNLTPNETVAIAQSCESHFKDKPTLSFSSLPPIKKHISLPAGSNLIFRFVNPSSYSSVTQQFFQVSDLYSSPKDDVLLMMLSHIGFYYAYDILRYTEGLGYSISFAKYSYGGQVLKVEVMGPNHPKFVEERINNFLLDLKEIIGNTTKETFEKYRNNTEILTYAYLYGFEFMIEEILSESKDFKKREIQSSFLQNVTLDDLVEFYNKNVLNPSTRRRLCVELISPMGSDTPSNYSSSIDNGQIEIKEPRDWRIKMGGSKNFISLSKNGIAKSGQAKISSGLFVLRFVICAYTYTIKWQYVL